MTRIVLAKGFEETLSLEAIELMASRVQAQLALVQSQMAKSLTEDGAKPAGDN